MLSAPARLLIHFVGAAATCGLLAYWGIRLMTPPPAASPPVMRAAVQRDPDPVLVAREFGQIETAATGLGDIQVAGVFSAGRDSAAVFLVGDRPAKAVRLGDEVAPGAKLVAVDGHSVTLESGGVRHELRVPNPPLAVAGPQGAGGAGFERRGNVLTAPMLDAAPSTRTPGARLPASTVQPRPEMRREIRPPGRPGEPAPGE